jgi:hypothetical protein
MIYKFKCAAAGDVIMLGPTGDRVLGLIGKSVATQGIIEPADMPVALQALADAVAADEAAREAAGSNTDAPKPDAISLRQRTWPLTQMMRRAHDADEPIVWGV